MCTSNNLSSLEKKYLKAKGQKSDKIIQKINSLNPDNTFNIIYKKRRLNSLSWGNKLSKIERTIIKNKLKSRKKLNLQNILECLTLQNYQEFTNSIFVYYSKDEIFSSIIDIIKQQKNSKIKDNQVLQTYIGFLIMLLGDFEVFNSVKWINNFNAVGIIDCFKYYSLYKLIPSKKLYFLNQLIKIIQRTNDVEKKLISIYLLGNLSDINALTSIEEIISTPNKRALIGDGNLSTVYEAIWKIKYKSGLATLEERP